MAYDAPLRITYHRVGVGAHNLCIPQGAAGESQLAGSSDFPRGQDATRARVRFIGTESDGGVTITYDGNTVADFASVAGARSSGIFDAFELDADPAVDSIVAIIATTTDPVDLVIDYF